MKKKLSILFFLVLNIGLLTTISNATEVVHEHQWSSSYVQGADRHWKECTVSGCTAKKDDGTHVYGNYKYVCDVCKAWESHECYNSKANCLYGGACEGCGYGAPVNPNNHAQPKGYGDMIDANSHKIICDCGYVFVQSEPHNFPNEWDDNGDGTEERWCQDCLYAVTRTKQSSGNSNSSGTTNNKPTTTTKEPSIENKKTEASESSNNPVNPGVNEGSNNATTSDVDEVENNVTNPEINDGDNNEIVSQIEGDTNADTATEIDKLADSKKNFQWWILLLILIIIIGVIIAILVLKKKKVDSNTK